MQPGRQEDPDRDFANRRRPEGLAEAAGKISPGARKALAQLPGAKTDARIQTLLQMKRIDLKFEKPDTELPQLPHSETLRAAMAKYMLAGKQ